MSHFLKSLLFILLVFTFTQCKNETSIKKVKVSKNEVKYAKGFSIINHEGYSIVKVTNPWPNAGKTFIYVLKDKNGILPENLKQFTTINIPIKTIVVTSTTHIPSLEMLGVEKTLVGFPNLNYISSKKVRALIDAKKVKELGTNQSLNTEILIDLQPEVIIGYGLDNHNLTLDNLQKNGLKVLLNGDWNEQTPLGKAEWIKFFGALYGKQSKANEIFSKIENDYLTTVEIAKYATSHPTI
jgi:iron complex transport system substrate-binding protein